jgi:hypothetical protein
MRAASIAAVYQEPIEPRTASSSTASRPTRWMTTGAGALPARKPGTRRLRPSERAACATRRSTSSEGTSAWTRTRDSGSSVTVVETGGDAIRPVNDTKPPVARRLAAWLYTGPLGHLVAGVVDWTELLARYWLARGMARVRAGKPRRHADEEGGPAEHA